MKREYGAEPESEHGFVEVQPADTADRHDVSATVFLDQVDRQHGLTIRFRDDIAIEVHPDTNMDMLARVLTLMVNLK